MFFSIDAPLPQRWTMSRDQDTLKEHARYSQNHTEGILSFLRRSFGNIGNNGSGIIWYRSTTVYFLQIVPLKTVFKDFDGYVLVLLSHPSWGLSSGCQRQQRWRFWRTRNGLSFLTDAPMSYFGLFFFLCLKTATPQIKCCDRSSVEIKNQRRLVVLKLFTLALMHCLV